MSDARELFTAVEMGLDAQAFLESRLGKYLVQRAEDERDEAMDELKGADSDSPKLIRSLQNRIWRAEQFQYWIAELIQSGNLAEEQLKEMDS